MPSAVPKQDPSTRLIELLKKAKYDPKKPPPPDQVVFTVSGCPVGSLGNFVAFTGRPKMGKSVYLSGCLASAMLPGDIWDMKLTLPTDRNHIQYYDTEQSAYHFHRLMGMSKRLMGMDNLPLNLSGYLLREFEPVDLMDMIEMGIRQDPKTSVVFVDGLLDLCDDYNDVRESKKVLKWLMRITKTFNILVIGVIHQSKKNEYSIGHLGSGVDRWAESTFLVEKDESERFISMSLQLSRNSIDKFPPVTITFNGEEFVQATIDLTSKKQQVSKSPAEFQDTEHKYMVGALLTDGPCNYENLKQSLHELKAIPKTKCGAFITYWQEHGYIFKDDKKMYQLTSAGRLFVVK
jgi:hypothetical protein